MKPPKGTTAMAHHLPSIRRLTSLLRLSKRGSIAIWLAVSFIPLVVAVGIAVDVTRAYIVKVHLEAALDDAGLAVAATTNSSVNLQTRLNQYFYGNFVSTQIGVPTTVTMSSPSNNSNVINLNATATLQPLFMQIMGNGQLTVAGYSQVTKEPTGLEVALVLDNTDSMECGDGAGTWSSPPTQAQCSQGVPPSHIDALVADVNIMVNQLFGANSSNSMLKMSIIPYVTSVNVAGALGSGLSTYVPSPGGAYKDIHGNAILDPYGNNIAYDATQSATGTGWWGCVIEPGTASSSQETSEPSGGWTGPWTAYYWQPNSFNGYSSNGGQGPWYTSTTSHGVTTVNLHIKYDPIDGDYADSDYLSGGPNLGCPSPMTRLTTNFSTIQSAVNQLGARENSGTIILSGMIWGWRSISPNPPFSDGLAYNTQGWTKVVILETDGIDNNYCDASHNTANEPLTGFSYCADGRMGSTNSTTNLTDLDADLQTLCTNMKAPNPGPNIVIFTIGLGQGANNAAMQNCAGGTSGNLTGTFYAAPTAASLQTAFASIASQLNAIRVSQ